MDELSSVVLLNEQDSACVLNFISGKKEKKNSSASDPNVHVLVTAGQGGVLRCYRVELNGKDISSFSCVSLFQMGPYDDFVEKPTGNHEFNDAIIGIHYLPNHHHIVTMTADYNIMTYRFAKIDKKKAVGDNEGKALRLHRHLIGCNDDILDMAVLNLSSTDDIHSGHIDNDVGDDDDYHKHCSVKFAVVTNSAQVRLMDSSNFACVSLNGHNDIVLAVDATPDG